MESASGGECDMDTPYGPAKTHVVGNANPSYKVGGRRQVPILFLEVDKCSAIVTHPGKPLLVIDGKQEIQCFCALKYCHDA